MTTNDRFPLFHWIARSLTGRTARCVYVAVLLILLLLTSIARVRSYLMARKIQAILHGLEQVRIDQTTEEELLRTVPYLTKTDREWKIGDVIQHGLYAQISNESDRDWLPLVRLAPETLGPLANWLGYRYMSFDASAWVQDGKVVRISYGLAREWGRPKALSYVVSASSFHGFWREHEFPFRVSSEDDESPQYRPRFFTLGRGDKRLNLTYSYDAPPGTTRHAFLLNLRCFWSLRGCQDAREISPELWQDVKALQAETYDRLISRNPCPDSIVEGRMRYLPDISVLLLEVTGSRRITVNEEGNRSEDWFTNYRVKEVIRGHNFGSWQNVRLRRAIPNPKDPMQMMANQVWPETKVGMEVLAFGGMGFDSCRIIPARPSALEIVRKAPHPPKRPGDQVVNGLQ